MFGKKPDDKKSPSSGMMARNVQVAQWGEDYTVQENSLMYDFTARKSMFGPKGKIVQWGGKYKA